MYILPPKELKYSTFSSCSWSVIICIGDGCLEILITLVFPTFISIPYYLPTSIRLSIMLCSTISSLASSTRSSAYFIEKITSPYILESPNPSRASLVRYSLYKLNRIGDKQHPCLIPPPIFILLVSPLSSHALTLLSIHNLLINLLPNQSIPLPFRICFTYM